jgi:Conjugal transfer protein TraD
LSATFKAIRQNKTVVLRVEANQRRTDKRDWVMQRRERTRHLIELGGLVQKAGLVELTDDDRQALLGAFLAVAARLQGGDGGHALAIWKRKGKQAFEAERNFDANSDLSL